METLNTKTLSFSRGLFAKSMMALVILFAMGACGDKGGNSVPPGYGNGIYPNCANCAGVNGSVGTFSAVSQTTGQARLDNVQILVQSQGTVTYPGGYPGTTYPGAYPGTYPNGYGAVGNVLSLNTYSGPVVLQGTFTATTQLQDPMTGGCIIPAGTYQLQTASAGQLNMGFMQIPDIVINGGMIHMTMTEGILYSEAGTGRTRIVGAAIYIRSVNGQTCSQMFSDKFN